MKSKRLLFLAIQVHQMNVDLLMIFREGGSLMNSETNTDASTVGTI